MISMYPHQGVSSIVWAEWYKELQVSSNYEATSNIMKEF